LIALVTGSSYRSCGQPPASQARHTASASAGLLTREDAGPGRRAAYSLTEASIQLVPVFAQLGEWGLHHRPTKKRLRVRAELLTAGGPELWREFMAELRTIHVGEPR
jgi:hypothetical protein